MLTSKYRHYPGEALDNSFNYDIVDAISVIAISAIILNPLKITP